MTCTSKCQQPTPSQAHCSSCHRTFGGVGSFDRHRVGGVCVQDDSLVERDGVWRQPQTEAGAARLAELRARRGG